MPGEIIFPIGYPTTYGTCPVCRTPHIKIEHGVDRLGHPLHYETCPECGDNIIIVAYDCPDCMVSQSLHFSQSAKPVTIP